MAHGEKVVGEGNQGLGEAVGGSGCPEGESGTVEPRGSVCRVLRGRHQPGLSHARVSGGENRGGSWGAWGRKTGYQGGSRRKEGEKIQTTVQMGRAVGI